MAILNLIKKFIGESKWSTGKDLQTLLNKETQRLHEIVPSETVIVNIWKRVFKVIKDESTM